MTRVLLTGAGGFVGSHTLRHILTTTDWNVVVIDSFRHKGTTDRITTQLEGLDRSRVDVFTHDLKAPISKQLAHKIGQIDYVISMASESHVDRSIVEPREFIENNVALVLTLLDYTKEYGVKKFLHVSTDEVYGPAENGHNHKEGESHKPSNPYSASKAAQEDICYSYWRTYGVPLIITNTMNIIGELQDPEKFVPKTIKQVLEDETMTIHASADGKIGSRYYLHARNQADALVFLLNNIDPVKYGEGEISQYNIVGELEVNNLDMAKMVAKYVGKPLKAELVDFHGSRPGHDLRYALDGTKLRKAGWEAPVSLEESLKKCVKWTLNNKEWLL